MKSAHFVANNCLHSNIGDYTLGSWSTMDIKSVIRGMTINLDAGLKEKSYSSSLFFWKEPETKSCEEESRQKWSFNERTLKQKLAPISSELCWYFWTPLGEFPEQIAKFSFKQTQQTFTFFYSVFAFKLC